MPDNKLLDGIHSPEDLKILNSQQLVALCSELREEIVRTVSRNGGHLAPNLGVIELTVALHRVFRMPSDQIVWDVGHQSYAHKLLTGRREHFHTLRLDDGISGFPLPEESEYDSFIGGHAGNAISAALGLAAARENRHESGHVVAVVGDGSLINGLSMEALNNVRSSCKNLIIVVNDNKMSISKSVGAIPNYLNRIITGRSYNRFKAFAKMAVNRLPSGEGIIGGIQKLEGAAKSLFVPGVFFEELGLRYIGPVNGHKLSELIQTFERIRDFNRPVIVHVITEKGSGCEYAIEFPEKFHGISSFNPQTGQCRKKSSPVHFSSAFGDALCALAEKDPAVIGITAAMACGTGMKKFAEKFPERFYDVGIAEGHALTFAAGIAANGGHPVVAIYGTFFQRALDSLFHDICLQNLPVILCIDRAGVVEDGPTHHGIYDETFALEMPNLTILAPKNEHELKAMFEYACGWKAPVMIRYPRGSSCQESLPVLPVETGKSEVLRPGSDLVLWAAGHEAKTALEAALRLEKEHGLSCKVVNARFLKPFDEAALKADAGTLPVFTLEDNLAGGGLDSIADRLLVNEKHHGVHHFAWPSDRIIPHGTLPKLREKFGMNVDSIVAKIQTLLRETPYP
ncbi:MAG: 1-deoxy-D-xylulose-5-phosphate synthase [Lentisphaerae bacterium ADurb.Bin242]|nr:MAG: 1-deoxy-D-xylulose-5-phosphate synthase [Lentisphaerae bacterium ADurb.Bin242]